MSTSHFEHTIIALVMQAILGLLTGNWWIGAAFGAAFFLGREHAQAQSKYNLGDISAFDVRRWSTDARLDIAFPVVAVVGVACCVTHGL